MHGEEWSRTNGLHGSLRTQTEVSKGEQEDSRV